LTTGKLKSKILALKTLRKAIEHCETKKLQFTTMIPIVEKLLCKDKSILIKKEALLYLLSCNRWPSTWSLEIGHIPSLVDLFEPTNMIVLPKILFAMKNYIKRNQDDLSLMNLITLLILKLPEENANIKQELSLKLSRIINFRAMDEKLYKNFLVLVAQKDDYVILNTLKVLAKIYLQEILIPGSIPMLGPNRIENLLQFYFSRFSNTNSNIRKQLLSLVKYLKKEDFRWMFLQELQRFEKNYQNVYQIRFLSRFSLEWNSILQN